MSALSGTGVGTVAALPAPPPPAEDCAEAVMDPARVVPVREVLALEEMPVDVDVLVKTLVVEVEVEDAESADVEVTGEIADVALLVFPLARGDIAEVGSETVAEADGVSRAFPVEVLAPAPAPDEDPAVFDPPPDDDDDPLVNADWM